MHLQIYKCVKYPRKATFLTFLNFIGTNLFQDGSSIDDLMTKSREGFTNIKNLYLELSELNRHLNQVRFRCT